MSMTIHQHITIHQLRVDTVSNSAVLQVGSAGCISSLAQLYNTGGFTQPAAALGEGNTLSFVPLPNPV